MKKLIYSLAFIGVITSCKSKTESAAEVTFQDSLRKVAIIDSIARVKADSIARFEAARKAAILRASNAQTESGAYMSETADVTKVPQ